MSDTQINRMGEVYIESAWRMAVGVCIQPTCCTDGITPTGEQCRRAFVSRERFDEHIAPLLHDLAKAQADLTAANARIKELEKDAARLDFVQKYAVGDITFCPPGNHGGGSGSWLIALDTNKLNGLGLPIFNDFEAPTVRAAIDKAREV